MEKMISLRLPSSAILEIIKTQNAVLNILCQETIKPEDRLLTIDGVHNVLTILSRSIIGGK
jgi:hypothetical protein